MKPTAILISLLTSLNRDHNKISGFLFGYGSANNDNHQGHQVGEGCSSFLPSDVMVCCSAFPAKEMWSTTQGRSQKSALSRQVAPTFLPPTSHWISLRLGHNNPVVSFNCTHNFQNSNLNGRSFLMSIRDGVSRPLLQLLAHSQSSITLPYLQTRQTSSLTLYIQKSKK